MHTKQTRHRQLEIPSDKESTAALLFSTKSYRRILANWASDLLQTRAEYGITMQLSLHVFEFKAAA